MGRSGAMDDDYHGYHEDLARANNPAFGDEGLRVCRELPRTGEGP